ncbi:MAG: 1-phosphofructokinase family hexose kinase [Defluviitaleaceae bacterium]|nr:1-phosphofructokinase family hexose kinase [Defluviitaleaceae bacterium]MCL2263027.1 1-phosphofructokinase family hexose kinase [Defluviitaleaceae bacterium]
MRIVTVNLNPCIDWVCMVESYTHGGLNRVRRVRSDVAGKGVNVAVALNNLGQQAICAGFNFAENGALLTEKLDGLGVSHRFIEAEGAIRVNMKLYEESTGVMTEINQPGAYVSEENQKQLLEAISRMDDKNGILVLSGSRPSGVAADFYAQICKRWSGKIFVDTEGEALQLALETGLPFALKPNLFELESTFGVVCKTPQEIASFCRENLLRGNVQIVCCSMGENGAVLVTPQNAFFCPALNVQAKGLAGAGDAMVAGLVYAIAKNLPQEQFLPTAMATAAASVILDGTQMCTAQGFSDMLGIMPTMQAI